MKQFKELGIKAKLPAFVGNQIDIIRVINKEITVHHFEVKPSKKNKGECLYMQISLGDTKHLLWTGAATLIDMIRQVPEADFPFKTIIEKKDERYQFT